MKIEAYIICWNEARILPWVLQYWHNAGIDKLIVYDNYSDDGTLSILEGSLLPVEVRHFDTGGLFDDHRHMEIKNTCWRGSDADWVFVGDADEVLYTPGALKAYLEGCEVPVIQPWLYQLVAWALPEVSSLFMLSYDDCYLLHQYPQVRLQSLGPNKVNLFRPSCVTDMGYGLGAHHCNPCYGDARVPVKIRPDISWLHVKNLGVEYLLQRNAELYARLPQKVKDERRIAIHYLPGTDVHRVAADLADMWADARPYTEYGPLITPL